MYFEIEIDGDTPVYMVYEGLKRVCITDTVLGLYQKFYSIPTEDQTEDKQTSIDRKCVTVSRLGLERKLSSRTHNHMRPVVKCLI